MSQDTLQISLEHHRAGRLVQAESGYRRVLSEDPDNAEAMHWLGVLLLQAKQTPEALNLLKRAADRRPDDPAYYHNLAQAYLASGQLDQAIASFDRATAVSPGQAESLLAAGLARLSRKKPGDADAAIANFRAALASGLDSAECHRALGIALLSTGKAADAITELKASLAKHREDSAALFHLALAHRAAGDLKETRKALIKSLEIEPTLAQGWCALAMLDAEAGRWAESTGLFRRAIAARRDYPEAWRGLAQALAATGKTAEAKQALADADKAARAPAAPASQTPSAPTSVADFERQLTPTPDQAQVHFALSALMNVFPPNQQPADLVEGLFDKYAPAFETHLLNKLEYRLPKLLEDAIRPLWSGKPIDILDLGCGTGLCGLLLKPMARTLAGVDLSAGMIDVARGHNIYDRLEVGDLNQALKASTQAYDLLICADVLNYVGELAPTFEAAYAALRAEGLFAFSVEASRSTRFELIAKSRRYAHAKSYIEHLATIFGFEIRVLNDVALRKEAGADVAGHLVILRRAG